MGLFKRKKKESPPPDPLAFLADGISSALATALPSAALRASLKISSHEACSQWLAAHPSRCLSLYGPSSVPWAGFFLPRGVSGGLDGDAVLEAFGLSWAASLPSVYRNAISSSLTAEPGDHDASLWPFLEMEAFTLDLGGTEGWFLIESGLRAALAGVQSGERDIESAPAPFTVIPRPSLIPALEPFVPASFAAGKRRFRTACGTFAFLSGERAVEEARGAGGADPDWYFASFDVQGTQGTQPRKLSFVYALDAKSLEAGQAEMDPDKVADALALGLFQESQREFGLTAKRALSNQALRKIPGPPDLSASGSVLFVKATLSGGSLRMPIALAAPSGALLPLLQAWLDPEDIKRGQAVPKSLVLKLSARLLPSRLKAALSPIELRSLSPRLLVSELLNQLSDGDYDLVLQNCLIASIGAKGLPALFYYTVPDDRGNPASRELVSPLGPLDPPRLLSRMPEALREDFARNADGLRDNPRDLCVEKNGEAMAEIAKAAARGRIAASARLSWLLKECYLKPSRAEAEAELAALKASLTPFASLSALPRPLAQRAMARVEDRDAALALLDATERKETLRPLVSKSRMGRLEEELLFLKRQYDSGDVEPAELVASKRLIAAVCEETELEEAKEAQLEKTGKTGGRPPEPRRGRP